jgi:hypothetical protein
VPDCLVALSAVCVVSKVGGAERAGFIKANLTRYAYERVLDEFIVLNV